MSNARNIAKERGLIIKEISIRPDQLYFLSMLGTEATIKTGGVVHFSETVRSIIDLYIEQTKTSSLKKGNKK